LISNFDNSDVEATTLKVYLQRHIDVDSNDHGPMAERLILNVCEDRHEKFSDAFVIAKNAIEMRIHLWDGIHK
jgi:hypothetical protein